MPTDWLADLSRSFKRHRQGRPLWHLQVHRDRLRLKSADLPPRPGGEDGNPTMRTLTLRTPPGPAHVKDALEEACKVFDAVMAGEWSWPDADAPPEEEGRITTATVLRLADQMQQEMVGERMRPDTWRRMWHPYLQALADAAGRGDPPEVTLAAYLKRWEPGTRARQMAHDRARAVWARAGLPWPSSITAMRGNGKAAADPAGVRAFSDAEIATLRERIQASARLTPGNLLAWDLLIVFGLRPAELQGLEVREEGGTLVATVSRVKVSSKGRSGPRTVPAVPPAGWPRDCHGLLQRWQEHGLPESILRAASPGEVLTQQLRRLRMPDDLSSYGLRHAFALRLGLEIGLHVREAAALMGHSPQTHLGQYGRRLDQPNLLAKVAGVVERRAS